MATKIHKMSDFAMVIMCVKFYLTIFKTNKHMINLVFLRPQRLDFLEFALTHLSKQQHARRRQLRVRRNDVSVGKEPKTGSLFY